MPFILMLDVCRIWTQTAMVTGLCDSKGLMNGRYTVYGKYDLQSAAFI